MNIAILAMIMNIKIEILRFKPTLRIGAKNRLLFFSVLCATIVILFSGLRSPATTNVDSHNKPKAVPSRPQQKNTTNSHKSLLVIQVNDVIDIPTEPSDSLAVSEKGVILIKEVPIKEHRGTLKVQGLKEGSVRLKVGTQNFTVAVVNEDQFQMYKVLQKFAHWHPHLNLTYHRNEFVFSGNFESPSEWVDLSQLHLHGFKIQTRVDPEQLKIVNFIFNQELLRNGLFPVRIHLEPFPTVRLSEIPVESAWINEWIRHFGLTIKKDPQQIHPAPLIRVQVLIAEVRKSWNQNLGIDWPQQLSAQIWPTGLLPLDSSFQLVAQFFEKEGLGQILAHPLLLTKSGSTAEFFAGGEFPIEIHYSHAGHPQPERNRPESPPAEKSFKESINSDLPRKSVEWKKYGIHLKIAPRSDAEGKISLDLETQVSSLDMGTKLESVPALFTNTMSTHFDLNRSQTIVLSGLIKAVAGNAVKKWPGLGDLPVLGPLFRSHDFQNDNTELLILVTPSIVAQD